MYLTVEVFYIILLMQVWLGRTLQKLDALLLEVCQEFKEDGYITVSAIFWLEIGLVSIEMEQSLSIQCLV